MLFLSLTATQLGLHATRISDPTNVLGWVERPSALPLMTAGQEPEFATDTFTLKEMLSNRFDPRRRVYLPVDAKIQVHAAGDRGALVQGLRVSPEHLSAEVTAARDTMVVVAQNFYHPWRACVDGRPVRIWKANYAFQAFAIPAGLHRVTLAYRDALFFWGSLVSLIFVVGVAALYSWSYAPKRKMQKSTVSPIR